MDAKREIEIRCLRYNPQMGEPPQLQTYRVPFGDETSVLEGLQYIKDHLDGSLTFRWSCRMAICGSCGGMIDGVPQLFCHTFLRDYWPGPVQVEPLTHFPILRDLAIDQTDFLAKLESVKPYIIPPSRGTSAGGSPPTPADGTSLQTPAQIDDYYQYSQCINCLLCYAACPQYGLDAGFTGPAALALLHRWNADSRDAGTAERMEVINGEKGVWGCTLVGYCSEVCPKGVDPARAVNQNKINSTKDWFMRFLAPRGGSK